MAARRAHYSAPRHCIEPFPKLPRLMNAEAAKEQPPAASALAKKPRIPLRGFCLFLMLPLLFHSELFLLLLICLLFPSRSHSLEQVALVISRSPLSETIAFFGDLPKVL